MQPSNQQQLVWGSGAYPVVTSTPLSAQNASNGKLWGSSVRRAMGIIQVICGIIQFALGTVVICLPIPYFTFGYFGWGIWNGVFAVVTGFLGVYSKCRKCMVIAYMVMSIIAAVLSGGCCFMTSAATPSVAYLTGRGYGYTYDYYNNFDDDHTRYKIGTAIFAIYIILAVLFFLQMLFSIIGASFTCGALTSNNNQQRMVYQLNAQPYQPSGQAPPYTPMATQIQPSNQDHFYTPLCTQLQPGSAGHVNPSYGQQRVFVSDTPANATVVTGNGTNMVGPDQTRPKAL